MRCGTIDPWKRYFDSDYYCYDHAHQRSPSPQSQASQSESKEDVEDQGAEQNDSANDSAVDVEPLADVERLQEQIFDLRSEVRKLKSDNIQKGERITEMLSTILKLLSELKQAKERIERLEERFGVED
jgi:predicted RNase H-like nuclease (RuvC/YqgF family)